MHRYDPKILALVQVGREVSWVSAGRGSIVPHTGIVLGICMAGVDVMRFLPKDTKWKGRITRISQTDRVVVRIEREGDRPLVLTPPLTRIIANLQSKERNRE